MTESMRASVPSYQCCCVCKLPYKAYATGYMYLGELLCSKACLDQYLADRTLEVTIHVQEEADEGLTMRGFTAEEAAVHQAGLRRLFTPTGQHCFEPKSEEDDQTVHVEITFRRK